MERKYPLMKKATAVWLVDNTSLTFAQIADFCGLHELEVQTIADEDLAPSVGGIDPIRANQLDIIEIERCTNDVHARLKLKSNESEYSNKKIKKEKRVSKYIPIARRQDKPDAIYWLIKNISSIEDHQIIKLIGTSRNTVSSIRNRSHRNMKNIRQRSPILLGLCTQQDIDNMIKN